MRLLSSHLLVVWVIVVSACTYALAAPGAWTRIPNPGVHLGIARDFKSGDQEHEVVSFSGIIEFNADQKNDEGKFPPETMSQQQFVTLVVLAYQEMLDLYPGELLKIKQVGRAMIALGIERKIFFASSMKGSNKEFYAGTLEHQQVNELVARKLRLCQQVAEVEHRTNYGCAEPNVLDLAVVNGETKLAGGRIAVWRTKGARGKEENAEPCTAGVKGYGCEKIVEEFQLSPIIVAQQPVGTGSEWQNTFSILTNRRNT